MLISLVASFIFLDKYPKYSHTQLSFFKCALNIICFHVLNLPLDPEETSRNQIEFLLQLQESIFKGDDLRTCK